VHLSDCWQPVYALLLEISDPNNAPEIFVSGPYNIMNAGGIVHLTFTTARPNPKELLQGSTTPEFQATVACRLVMPLEMAQQLSRTLASNISKTAQITDTMPEIVIKPN
jgi:hypothetical protein